MRDLERRVIAGPRSGEEDGDAEPDRHREEEYTSCRDDRAVAATRARRMRPRAGSEVEHQNGVAAGRPRETHAGAGDADSTRPERACRCVRADRAERAIAGVTTCAGVSRDVSAAVNRKGLPGAVA